MGGIDAGGGKGFSRRHAFKILCPDELVARVLGTRGARKDQMQEETRCKIQISGRDEYFPGTLLRLMAIVSETIDGPIGVLDRLVSDVVECGAKESLLPGASEPAFLGAQTGQYVLRAAVSRAMSSAIIGVRGANVKFIQQESGAKVIIHPEVVAGHQMVTVMAEPHGLRVALAHIYRHVQEDAGSPDYEEWLAARPIDAGVVAFGGKATGSKGGSHGKDSDRQVSRERSPRRTAASLPDMDVDQSLLQAMSATAQEFPPGALEMEYTITFELPTEKVTQLIGKGGADVQRIRKATGTAIHFEQPEDGMEGQVVQIKGPLLKIYRAHALLMRRYHETSAEDAGSKPTSVAAGTSAQSTQELEDQIQSLQRQMATVESLRKLVQPQTNLPPTPPPPPPEAAKKGAKGKGKGKKGKSR